MLHFVEVLGGMLVLGRIATSHVPTSQAKTQVHPGITSVHTFFAYMLAGVLDLDLVEMRALISHIFLSEEYRASASSDFRYTAMGLRHIRTAQLSLTIIAEGLHTCFVLIIFLVC